MVWRSNRASVERREVSLLAVVETVVCSAALFGYITWTGSVKPLLWLGVMAPFFLLRTHEATVTGLRWFDWFSNRLIGSLENLSKWVPWLPLRAMLGVVVVLLFFPAWGVGAMVIRAACVVWATMRRPLGATPAVVDNWRKQVLSVDLAYPPEIVPGVEEIEEHTLTEHRIHGYRFRDALKDLRDESDKWFRIIFAPLFFGALFLPAILYRFSIKSVSLVYAPLVLILDDARVPDAAALENKFKLIAHDELERVKRVYSWIVLLALGLAPAVLYVTLLEWWKSSGLVESIPAAGRVVLSVYLFLFTEPLRIEGWHLARFFNALLTLGLFVWARRRLLLGEGAAPDGRRLLSALLLVRGLLTLYVLGCTLWVLGRTMPWEEIFRIRIEWWPKG